MVRGRTASAIVLAVLLGLTVLVVIGPSARAQVGSKTITVDGDPSDWTGVNVAPDTGVVDASEFVWNDTVNDDTGDGNYVYPTSTDFSDGLFDIQEVRITADATNLYVLVKVVNLTNPWGGSDGFSTAAAVLLIDTTQDGSGTLTARPNVNIASGSGWEYFVKIGNTGWHAENAKIFDEAGNWAPIGNKASTSLDAVEASIPLAFIGKDGYDIDGATWRFMVFLQSHAGENQDGFRDVNETAEAYLFGGGLSNNNNDPKIQDIAFATSQAVQEAELSSYTLTTLATMASFADVTFDGAIGFTPDTAAPTISSVVAAPTFNQAVVTWTSDEIANTAVWYTSATQPLTRRFIDEFVTGHSVTLSALDSTTVYYYWIESTDIAGNLASTPLSSFTTSSPPPANFASWTSGKFVWEDARGDDTGDGNYVYPNEPTVKWQGRGDIWFLNITLEGNWIHYTVRVNAQAETIWRQRMAAFVMFIDQDHIRGSGARNVKFIQPESDPGHPLNISVAPEFAWEWMIVGTFQNYSEFTPGDNRTELLIRNSTFDAGLNTYSLLYMSTALGSSPRPTAAIADSSNGGTQLDFWLNRSIIGKTDNWTYVALGALYDDAGAGWPSGGIRQVKPSAQTWEGGGANGPLNPNVYDLAFYPGTPSQALDLAQYIPSAYTSITRAMQINLTAQWYGAVSVASVLGVTSRSSVSQLNTGESAGVTAFVTNRNLPLSEASVTLSASPSAAVTILAPNPSTTDTFGSAQFTVRANVVSVDTVVTLIATATVGADSATSTVTITVKAQIIPHAYRVFLAAADGVLGSGQQSSVTATFTDKGAPISGATVTLASDQPALAVITLSAATNAQGQATFTVRAAYSEADVAATLTATGTNATVQTTGTVSMTVKAFVHVYAMAGTASATLVEADATTTVTFTFRDAGAARAGATVAISLSPGTGFDIVGDASKTTDASGQATFTLRAKSVTSDTSVVVTATAGNGTAANVATSSVTVVAGAAPPAPTPAGISPTVFGISVGVLVIIAVALGVLWMLARRSQQPPKREGDLDV